MQSDQKLFSLAKAPLILSLAITATLSSTLLPLSAQALPLKLQWAKQLGTSDPNESAEGVATDSTNNVYITGFTGGALGGANKGGSDTWVAKYNNSGTLQWKNQLGSPGDDYSFAVTTDSKANIYISGSACGSVAAIRQLERNKRSTDSIQRAPLRGGHLRFSLTHPGSFRSCNALVAKYNSNGKLQWTKQLGSSVLDESLGVATDSTGNIYIAGYTNGDLGGTNKGGSDAWVAKYNSSGILQWKTQSEISTTQLDQTNGIATDSTGDVYVTGFSGGDIFNPNADQAWIAKYNSRGKLQWKKQVGTSKQDQSNGIATDSTGNVYISGFTTGSLGGTNKGSYDAWVAKYNSNGKPQWTKQLGTAGEDLSNSVTTDSAGNVYLAGATNGSLERTNKGSYDVWVAKYSNSGTLQWKKQLGTSDFDSSNSVATDSTSNVYLAGLTDGSLGGANKGGGDAWVTKYHQ
jgi:hypothetical protein